MMRRLGLLRMRDATIPSGVALGLAALAANFNFAAQNATSRTPFQAHIRTHETRAEWTRAGELQNASETAADVESIWAAPPTHNSFVAKWNKVSEANGYLLDVSANDSFGEYVEGYHDLDVGNVSGRVVTGLNPGKTYYYRVRAYNLNRRSQYSEVMAAATVGTTGLTISASFDSSITNNPNAAAIEAMINRAISIYESLFSDPFTVHILYRYATTLPNGDPIPAGSIARSSYVYYTLPWDMYINALRADAKTPNDSLANSSLPSTALSTNINVSSAGGRAIDLNTPPNESGGGTVGGPYDGIVTLNSSVPWEFSRPVTAGNFDAQRLAEHEMDEVMGFASHLSATNQSDLWPQDLFSWSSAGHRNITASGVRYFSINGGVTNIVGFNQTAPYDFGDWLIENCPQMHVYVQNAFNCTGQSADIAATSPEGINLDVIGYDLIQISLGNISTRSFVQTGEHVMIGGFIVQGTGTKKVIIRAIGPELGAPPYNLPGALADPTLELHNAAGALIGSNDNWQTTIIGGIITSNQVSDIQNSGHAPTSASESAIIADLPPGNYTAVVSGVSNTTGLALVEAYDLSPDTTSVLGNISTRGFVQTGADVMIGGFIVQGTGAKKVIIRAIGPELMQYGITDVLANPTLQLYNASGVLIGSNDNWQTTIIGGIITSNQVSDIQNSGHVPTDANESAIIANLAPGNYTAIVSGVSNTTGVALVEVYDLN
jgi:hypothetical protein